MLNMYSITCILKGKINQKETSVIIYLPHVIPNEQCLTLSFVEHERRYFVRTIEVNGVKCFLVLSSKYLLLCSAEERKLFQLLRKQNSNS